MPDHYVWLIWSSAFLVPWALLYGLLPSERKVMLRASLLTLPFGLTEPLFVPRYWNPPSLFELAQRTGFDVESLIFCFALGGVAVVFYNAVTRKEWTLLATREVEHQRHRFHMLAVSTPIMAFPMLYLLPWNPIYPAIASMAIGALATTACRPDLKAKTFVGGLLFVAYYAVFMLELTWSVPGYIDRVWNLKELTGVLLHGVPLEELLFGLTFGMYWSGVYEHLTWHGIVGGDAAISWRKEPTPVAITEPSPDAH